MAWHDEYPHSVWASVLLLDNKIENWKIGGHKRDVGTWTHYWKRDRLGDYIVVNKEFTANNQEDHERIFERDGKDFINNWEYADDYRWSKA